MILPYSYWYFESAIPSSICDRITAIGQQKMEEQVAQYGEKSIEATTGDKKQKNSDFIENAKNKLSVGNFTSEGLRRKGLTENDVYVRDTHVVFLDFPWLYELIWEYVHAANKAAGWNFEWDYTEEMQFTKYNVNQFYGWHADASSQPYEKYNPNIDEQLCDANGKPMFDIFGNPIPKNPNLTLAEKTVGKIRKLSVTVSLNDPAEYKGGNLRFDFGPHFEGKRYHTCKEIRPKGSVIVFPSHIHHQVTPVTEGTRYSLVAWNLGLPWK